MKAHSGNDYITITGNEIYNNNRHSSNGTHAVSLKGLNSSDTEDGFKIIVTDNKFHENCYTLVSWMTSKTAVAMEIDEGKFIHFQDAWGTVDATSGAKAKC